MRKIFVIAIIFLVGAFFFVGCGGESIFSSYPKEVKFEVTSSPSGKKFTGAYGNTKSTISVGPVRTPQTYTTQLEDEWDAATGVFQKDDPGTWTLTVKVYVDGKLKDQASTSAEYGMVTLTVTGKD